MVATDDDRRRPPHRRRRPGRRRARRNAVDTPCPPHCTPDERRCGGRVAGDPRSDRRLVPQRGGLPAAARASRCRIRARAARAARRRSSPTTTSRSSAGCGCAGKCRACGSAISWRYPLVEAATGLLCGLVRARQGLRRGRDLAAARLRAAAGPDHADRPRPPHHPERADARSARSWPRSCWCSRFEPDALVEHLIAGVAAGGFFLVAAIVVPARDGDGRRQARRRDGPLPRPRGRPAIFVALISGTLVGALIMARYGRRRGPQEGHPVRPLARPRRPRRPVRGRRDRRLVPRHLHASGRLGPQAPPASRRVRGVPISQASMRAVNLLPPDLAARPRPARRAPAPRPEAARRRRRLRRPRRARRLRRRRSPAYVLTDQHRQAAPGRAATRSPPRRRRAPQRRPPS